MADAAARLWPSTTTDHRPLRAERSRVVSTYSGTFETDAIGVLPTLILILTLVLTALGIVAHVAFA
jgi:hypothetical protein